MGPGLEREAENFHGWIVVSPKDSGTELGATVSYKGCLRSGDRPYIELT